MAITIAELKAILTADTSSLEGGLSRTETALQRTAKTAEDSAARTSAANERVTQATQRRANAVQAAADAEIRAEEAATAAEEKRAAAAVAAGDLVIAKERAQVAAIRQAVQGRNNSTKATKAAFAEQAQAQQAYTQAVLESEDAQATAARASAQAFAARGGVVRAEAAETAASLRAEALAAQQTAAEMEAASISQLASIESVRKAVQGAWTTFSDLSAIITVLGAGTAIMSSSFDDMTQKVIGNTQLSQTQIKAMRDTILDLSKTTGASFEDLANGYKETTDYGFSAAESAHVLAIATQESVGTGSDLTTTVKLLSNTLHEFSIPAAQASAVMNTLHQASAMANTTMDQFVKSSGLALGQAANYGVAMKDAAAALAALTLHGFDASRASTQVAGLLVRITNPAKQAKDSIKALSQMTGVNLVKDFSAAGLQSKGLFGVLQDLKKATGDNVELVNRLIPAMRGGQSAIVLMGSGAADYNKILKDLNATMSGKSTPSTDAFNQRMQTVSQQFRVLVQQIKVEFLPVGEKFAQIFVQTIPTLKLLADTLNTLLGLFTKLPPQIQQFVLGVGAMSVLQKLVLPHLVSLGHLLPEAARGFSILASAVKLLAGPVGWIALAVTLLIAAWITDFGHIREITASFYDWLKGATGVAMEWFKEQFGEAWTAIVKWTKDNWPQVRQIIENVWTVLAPFVGTAVGIIWGLIKTAWAGIVAITKSLWPVIRSLVILIFGTVADIVSFFTKLLSGDWKGAWFQLIDTVKNLGGRLWDSVKAIFSSIADFITGIIPSFVQLGKNLWGGIVEGWTTGLQSDPITVQISNAVNSYQRKSAAQAAGGLPGSADPLGDPGVSGSGRKPPRSYLMPPSVPNFPSPSAVGMSPMGITGDQLDAATAAMKKHQKDTQDEASKTRDALIQRYQDVKAQMLEEIALSGKDTEASKMLYETQKGEFKDLQQSQKDELVAYAQRLDKVQQEIDARKTAKEEAKKAADELTKSYQDTKDRMLEGIRMQGRETEVAKLNYELQYGSLQGISKARRDELMNLAKQTDAQKVQKDASDALLASYKDIRDNMVDQIHTAGLLTNVQKVSYAEEKGALQDLSDARKQELLQIAKKLDLQDQEADRAKIFKDLADQLNLSTMSKDMQDIIQAAGGMDAWTKLGSAGSTVADALSDAQQNFITFYNVLRDNKAVGAADDAMKTLSRDTSKLGKDLEKSAVDAVGGMDNWTRLSDDLKNQLLTTASRSRAIQDLYALDAQYAKQAADAIHPLRTATQQVEDAIASLIQKAGAASNDPAFKSFLDSLRSSAKQIDQASSGNEYAQQLQEQFNSINDLAITIGGMYTPGMKAAAEWEAQNQKLIQDLRAAFGDQIAQQMIDQYENILKQAKALEEYNQGVEQMRKLHEDVYAKVLQMGQTDPFKRWLDSLKVYDWTLNNGLGGFRLPNGMDEDSLKKLFDYQQRLNFALDTADKISGVLKSAFDDAYDNGFKGFFNNVIAGFRKMLYQMAIEYLQSQILSLLQKALLGAVGATSSKQPAYTPTGGGITSTLTGLGVSLVPSLLGSFLGGGGSAVSASVPKPTPLPAFPTYFASGGGTLIPGEPTLVGEDGPEVVMTRSRGMRVIPNSQLNGSSTKPVVVYMTVSSPDAQGFRRSSSVIAAELSSAINTAQRRNSRNS